MKRDGISVRGVRGSWWLLRMALALENVGLWPPGLWFGGHAWRWQEQLRIAFHMPLSAWFQGWRRRSYFRFERQLEPFPPFLVWLLLGTLLAGVLFRDHWLEL